MKRFLLSVLCSCLLLPLCGPAVAADVIMCVGDSITAGYGVTAPYPSQLQSMVGGKATVVNKGLNGEMTTGGLSRLNGYMLEVKPQYVLILEGANDAIFGVLHHADHLAARSAAPVQRDGQPDHAARSVHPLD